MKPVILVANLKLHNSIKESVELARAVSKLLVDSKRARNFIIAPSFLAISKVSEELLKTKVRLAAQDVFWEPSGAFTGEVGTEQLKEIGVDAVIVGHSERRERFCETNETAAKKIQALKKAEMTPILCIGETGEEYNKGKSKEQVARQVELALDGLKFRDRECLYIAYEPRWAVGTDDPCDPDKASEMHKLIRDALDEETKKYVRILYGGSVTKDNARAYLKRDYVDGVLVGRASTKLDSLKKLLKECSIV